MTFIFIFVALSVVWWMWARPFIRKRWQQQEHRQLIERREEISALHSKAVALRKEHRHEEAIAVLDQIEKKFHHEIDPNIRRDLSRASKEWVLNRGLLHPDNGKLPPGLDFDRDYLPSITYRRNLTIKLCEEKGLSVADVPAVAEEKKIIKSYLCKVFSLEKLNRDEEALAVLKHVETRVGFKLDPIVRAKESEIEKKIAAKHFPPSASYDDTHKRLILQAKRAWADEAHRQALLLKVATSNTGLLLKSNDLNVGIEARIRGDLAYALFLLGRYKEARQALWECLQLDKKSQQEAQRAYTQQHRINPQDSDYEALLMEVWEVISSQNNIKKS